MQIVINVNQKTFFLVLTALVTVVFAVAGTAAVFHKSEQVQPGVFGSDAGFGGPSAVYVFTGSVGIGNITNPGSASLNVSKNIAFNTTGAGIVFADGTFMATAATGGGDGVVNSTAWNRTLTNVILHNIGDFVGIGTPTPAEKLHVEGNATVKGNMTLTNGSGIIFIDSASNRVGIGTATPAENLHVEGNATVKGNLTVGSGTVFVDGTSNKVGIGTVLPNASLQVVGTAAVRTNLTVGGTSANDGGVWINNSQVRIGTRDTVRRNSLTVGVGPTATLAQSIVSIQDESSASTEIFIRENGTAVSSGSDLGITFQLMDVPAGDTSEREYSIGLDSSDAGIFKIGRGTAVGGTNGQVFAMGGNDSTATRIQIGTGGGEDGTEMLKSTAAQSNLPGMSVLIAQGALCVDNAGNNCDDANRVLGTIYAVSNAITALDVAETYPTLDSTLAAGEVVLISAQRKDACVETKDSEGVPVCAKTVQENVPFVSRSTNARDASVIGVVSTEPGLLLGGFANEKYRLLYKEVPVALSGRVPVKVTAEGGAIKPGDWLTSSSTPGHAMRCADKTACVGAVVGKALEPWDSGSGKILVLVTLQ